MLPLMMKAKKNKKIIHPFGWIFLCEGRTAQIVSDFVFENDKWLGNAQTNERINKVRACDEKLFFSLNIGNGLISYCE